MQGTFSQVKRLHDATGAGVTIRDQWSLLPFGSTRWRVSIDGSCRASDSTAPRLVAYQPVSTSGAPTPGRSHRCDQCTADQPYPSF